MSARLSAGLPRACSGDMYDAVPISTLCPVTNAGLVIVGDMDESKRTLSNPSCAPPIRARPKSSTFTVPSGVIWILAGFRSRCTIPCSCAASSASTI